VKGAIVNRVLLNIHSSGAQQIKPVSRKLDQTKKFETRSGQAKKNFLNINNAVNLFARFSDMWSCFEDLLLEMLSDKKDFDTELEPQSLCPIDVVSVSDFPLQDSGCDSFIRLRPGRGRASGV
jgi:hypothetical protein